MGDPRRSSPSAWHFVRAHASHSAPSVPAITCCTGPLAPHWIASRLSLSCIRRYSRAGSSRGSPSSRGLTTSLKRAIFSLQPQNGKFAQISPNPRTPLSSSAMTSRLWRASSRPNGDCMGRASGKRNSSARISLIVGVLILLASPSNPAQQLTGAVKRQGKRL